MYTQTNMIKKAMLAKNVVFAIVIAVLGLFMIKQAQQKKLNTQIEKVMKKRNNYERYNA